MPGWAVGQLVVTDADGFPNGAPFTFTILSGNAELVFRVVSDGTLYTAARLSTRVRTVHYLQVRVGDSGFPHLHTDTWVTVKVREIVLEIKHFELIQIIRTNGVNSLPLTNK